MAATSSLAQDVTELTQSLSGDFLSKESPGYDEAREVHNGLIDQHPRLIARCRGVADIVDVANLAQQHHLDVTVRGGGHNLAGRAVQDGALMIDLSAMKGICVDPEARTVRAQGGVTWGELNRETQLHGLATTGGVISTTGIGGLTLGGGYGWLAGKCGAVVDNVLSAQFVMADGRIVTASDRENPDLFWAARGAGANFGVAASLEYRLHPIGPTITAGIIAYPIDGAREVFQFCRDIMESAPDELCVMPALLYAADGSGPPMAGLLLSHCGTLEAGEEPAQRVHEFGAPLMDVIGPMSYCQLNAILDDYYPPGISYYWKARFLTELSDEAIDTMIDCFARCPNTTSQMVLEPYHGAVSRVEVDAMAFPLRAKGYNLLVLSQWTDPSETDPCVAWTRESYDAMEPFMTANRYSNYLAYDETGDPVSAAYGPNYQRLRELKTKYDPGNFFHVNANIPPLS